MSQEDSVIKHQNTLEMAKKLTIRINRLSKSLHVKHVKNTSNYVQVNLAEFSTLYDPQSAPKKPKSRNIIDDQESDESTGTVKKLNVRNYIQQKIAGAALISNQFKVKIKEDTMKRYIYERNHPNETRKNKTPQPNIANEVVKLCSNPNGYIQFRSQFDFLPVKATDTHKHINQSSDNTQTMDIRQYNSTQSKFGEEIIDTVKLRQQIQVKMQNKRKTTELGSSKMQFKCMNQTGISLNEVPLQENYSDLRILDNKIDEARGSTEVHSFQEYLNNDLIDPFNPTEQLEQVKVKVIDEVEVRGRTMPLTNMSPNNNRITINMSPNNNRSIGSNSQIRDLEQMSSKRRHFQRFTPADELTVDLSEQVIKMYNTALQQLTERTKNRVTESNSSYSDAISLRQQQQLLISALKVVSVERNLSDRQFKNLLLQSLKRIIQIQIRELQMSQSPSQNQSLQDRINKIGDEEMHNFSSNEIRLPFINQKQTDLTQSTLPLKMSNLQSKLKSLVEVEQNFSTLESMQLALRGECEGIKKALRKANDSFSEIESFYNMIKEGDMPEFNDAQILFEVKKLGIIWDTNLQLQEIQKFKSINDQNSNGLILVQKYEHTKFVKENIKRRFDLKQM